MCTRSNWDDTNITFSVDAKKRAYLYDKGMPQWYSWNNFNWMEGRRGAKGEIKRERENYLKLLCDFRQIPFSILQMVNFHIPFSWILNKGFDELQFSCSGLSSVLCSNRYWAEKCWVSQAWWSILWILVVKWKVDPLYQNVRQERLWDYRFRYETSSEQKHEEHLICI